MQNVLAALVAFAASGYIIAVTAQGSAPFVTLGQFYGTNSNSPPSFYVVVNGISFSTAIAGDATSFDTCLSSCQATCEAAADLLPPANHANARRKLVSCSATFLPIHRRRDLTMLHASCFRTP